MKKEARRSGVARLSVARADHKSAALSTHQIYLYNNLKYPLVRMTWNKTIFFNGKSYSLYSRAIWSM